ncbi:hypothetical protein RchiOBHm_Chr1g0347611 [Rosa chinensis]|uniref:Uncharacterized protein n=1 Tax=Rosa chinensis TaxID=74649 RepID=A0A2P6SFC2_ROSCH|nr:hypothetical protein RchiOBHm_Chr1g0347611 [Rosa chinensis]
MLTQLEKHQIAKPDRLVFSTRVAATVTQPSLHFPATSPCLTGVVRLLSAARSRTRSFRLRKTGDGDRAKPKSFLDFPE